MSGFRRTKIKRRGAALVELAMVLPIFFMVVLSTIEFGRALMSGQMITEGARLGARLASMDGSTNIQVIKEVDDFCKSVLGSGTTFDITITITPAPGNVDPLNDLSLANVGDLCEVRVKVPFESVSLFRANYLKNKSMNIAVSMPHE